MKTQTIDRATQVRIIKKELREKFRLEGKLSVKDLQGGFAGFNGKVYTVDTDGSYTVGNEARGRVTESASSCSNGSVTPSVTETRSTR